MGGPDCDGYDRTFKVSFSQDGLSRLHAKVMEKLKEFMGDYTDDTLVVRFCTPTSVHVWIEAFFFSRRKGFVFPWFGR